MATIQLKRGLEAALPQLKPGEMGFCTDSNNIFIGTTTGNQLIGKAEGVMTSGIYDTNNSGVVDRAESIDWTGVENKPTEYNPTPHHHDTRYYTENEVDNLLTGKSNASHTHDSRYLGISAKATDSDKLDGIDSSGYKRRYSEDLMIDGDSNTYYPVVIQTITLDPTVVTNIEIYRGYNWTAPDTWNTATHRGGLWAVVNIALNGWGGFNYDHAIIVSQQYSSMVGDIRVAEPDTDTLIVWLRGGGAKYRITYNTDQTNIHSTVYYDQYVNRAGTQYERIYTPLATPVAELSSLGVKRFIANSTIYLGTGYRDLSGGSQIATESWVNSQGYITGYTNNFITGISGNGNGTLTVNRQGLSNLTTVLAHSHNYLSTSGGTLSGSLTLNSGVYNHHGSSSYDKVRVWNSSSYTIGMVSAQSYGYLNDYAMTFTMNADSDRGFLWRDTSDSASDGAMSLTTDGRLYVKNIVNADRFFSRSKGAYCVVSPSATSLKISVQSAVPGSPNTNDLWIDT